MKFNIDDYPGEYCMHCKTEKEAISFCEYLDSVGRNWRDGSSYILHNEYTKYKEQTCYEFNGGTYGSLNYFKEENYKILDWSDFMNKEFTKSDLKNGDVVLKMNGAVEIVCVDTGTLISKNGFNYLSSICGGAGDIVAVRRPTQPGDCQFDAFDKNFGKLVYERKEEQTLHDFDEVIEDFKAFLFKFDKEAKELVTILEDKYNNKINKE